MLYFLSTTLKTFHPDNVNCSCLMQTLHFIFVTLSPKISLPSSHFNISSHFLTVFKEVVLIK